jgi:hypothetical protein
MKAATIPVAIAWMLGWSTAVADEVGGRPESGSRQEPAPTETEVSFLGGFGAGGQSDHSAVNRYGLGLGGRVGRSLKAPSLYLGISLIGFFGGEDQWTEYHTKTVDIEVGYNFRLLRNLAVVRPKLALGIALVDRIQSDNAGRFMPGFHWAPGLLVGMRLSPILVSAEVRRDMLLCSWGSWPSAVTLILGCGVVL